ncbi:MAG: imelysin family protein [Alcanivorax sp.]|uniref:imelysin family protein n=1 Tax=Alcanivorax sp. TaxID=1872427 RepID=UPI003DA7052F
MRYFLAALLAMMLSGCDNNTPEPAPSEDTDMSATVADIPATDWQQNADKAFQEGAAAWQQALNDFDQHREQAQLDALREHMESWYAAFVDHYLLAASRACQLEQQELLNRMDSWPLYPGYLDALPQWPESGLISDPYLEMTRKSLRTQHGATDASEASLGFAALFVALNGTEETPKALPMLAGDDEIALRRRQYLQLAAEQLQTDAKLLSVEAPLDSQSLKCGLEQTLARDARKDSSDLEAEGLFIPATVREVNTERLLKGVRNMDQTTLETWAEKAPGIEEAITASKKAGSEALATWLDQH